MLWCSNPVSNITLLLTNSLIARVDYLLTSTGKRQNLHTTIFGDRTILFSICVATHLRYFPIWFCCAAVFTPPIPSSTAATSGRTDRKPVSQLLQSEATFCPSPLKTPFGGSSTESLGFCARASEATDTGGLSLLTLWKLFYPVVPCATSFKRGALKIKGKLCELSAVTAYQAALFHVVWYLFVYLFFFS